MSKEKLKEVLEELRERSEIENDLAKDYYSKGDRPNGHMFEGISTGIDIAIGEIESVLYDLCEDCDQNEKNPGLDVCGSCYHKRIWGDN